MPGFFSLCFESEICIQTKLLIFYLLALYLLFTCSAIIKVILYVEILYSLSDLK